MPAAMPARSAFASAAWIAPASLSEAIIFAAEPPLAALASVTNFSHIPVSKFGQSIKAKCLLRPGGIFRANRAASMAMVPAPQKGSSSGEEASHPEANKIPAARVSRKGALPVASR